MWLTGRDTVICGLWTMGVICGLWGMIPCNSCLLGYDACNTWLMGHDIMLFVVSGV